VNIFPVLIAVVISKRVDGLTNNSPNVLPSFLSSENLDAELFTMKSQKPAFSIGLSQENKRTGTPYIFKFNGNQKSH
jgi:hypothetical protein